MNTIIAPRYAIPPMVERPSMRVISKTERYAEDIKFLKKYVKDLRNGILVENISPSNDPYFLVPENIESIIRGIEDMMHGRFSEIDINTLFD